MLNAIFPGEIFFEQQYVIYVFDGVWGRDKRSVRAGCSLQRPSSGPLKDLKAQTPIPSGMRQQSHSATVRIRLPKLNGHLSRPLWGVRAVMIRRTFKIEITAPYGDFDFERAREKARTFFFISRTLWTWTHDEYKNV